MENEFLIDSEFLSPKALEKKHRLENDPSYRKNHMEYMPGMEVIESDVCKNVMDHMNSYDYSKYTAKDVRKALEHETCSIEDFKALLSPAAEPFLEQMAQRARVETSKHFGNTVYMFTPLYIANYCENYCVYCGFNCYNHINRMKLSMEQIEKEMKVIADSGMEEILILTGESRGQSNVEYIGEACKLARKYFRMVGLEIYPVNTDEYEYLHKCGADYVTVSKPKEYLPVNIKTMPYPGFPTDLQQPFTVLLTQCDGKSKVEETIYENRFMHIAYLNDLGADITVKNQTATVFGPTSLVGTKVVATDLRAGAAMVVAGLLAKGTTTITNIEHILRGYEQIVEKLISVGAKIENKEI